MADEKFKEAMEELFAKARVVQATFSTKEGKECLEVLRRQFAVRLEADDAHKTTFKAGRADVYLWIVQMMNLTQDGR